MAYWESESHLSLPVALLISSCRLLSADPARNAEYRFQELQRIQPDWIQTDADRKVVLDLVRACRKHIPNAKLIPALNSVFPKSREGDSLPLAAE